MTSKETKWFSIDDPPRFPSFLYPIHEAWLSQPGHVILIAVQVLILIDQQLP